MSKFKKGDKVRILSGIYIEVGLNTGDISHVDYISAKGDPHIKDIRGVPLCFYDSELELVESAEKHEPSIKITRTLLIKDHEIDLTKAELYDLMEVIKGELNETN